MQKDSIRGFLLSGNVQPDVARFGKFDGVAEEVDDDLAETLQIAKERRGNSGIQMPGNFEVLLAAPELHDFQDFAQASGELKFERAKFHHSRVHFGEVQNVIEQAEKRIGRSLYHFQIFALLRGDLGVENQVGHAENSIHRGAEFMADVSEEFAFCAAGCFGGFLGGAQRVLILFANGNIARSHADGPARTIGGINRADARVEPALFVQVWN